MSAESGQKLAELRDKAREKFSDQEIDNFISMGRTFAGKAVVNAVIEVVKEGPSKGFSQKTCDALVKKLEKRIPCKFAGYFSCEFKEIPEKLHMSLVIAPNNYKTDIDIPSLDYVNDLYRKYDMLKNIAIAYWSQFAEENPDLYNAVCEYRADVNFNLTIDTANPTTLYFDPDCAKRIGIYCYYVDKAGRILYKK